MTLSRGGCGLVLLSLLAGCSGSASEEQMMSATQRITRLEARADAASADISELKSTVNRPVATPIQPTRTVTTTTPPGAAMPSAPPASTAAAPTPAASPAAPPAAPAQPAAPAAGAPASVVPPAAAAATPATPPAAATPPAGELQFAVHLASYKQEAEATKGWSQLQARFAALKPMQARLSRVDLGPKGVYFRLKAGPLPDQKAAEALCRQLKSAGAGYCNPEGFDGKPLGS